MGVNPATERHSHIHLIIFLRDDAYDLLVSIPTYILGVDAGLVAACQKVFVLRTLLFEASY